MTKKSSFVCRALSVLLLLIFTVSLVACSTEQLQGENAKQLAVPTNVRVDGGTLRWNPVEQAIGYTVEIKLETEKDSDAAGNQIMVSSNEHSLLSLSSGDYTLRVKARGDSVLYSSSEWSNWIEYTRITDTGEQYEDEITGAFGSFDEINTRESYLGYGIDIINATGVTSKNIKTTYPIFSKNAILNEILLKSNEHYSNLETIESSTIEDFKTKLAASSSISSGAGVSASANIFGVSVGGGVSFSNGFKSTFEQTSTDTHSQYFLEIIAENQNYWLMLQTSEERYKELLSEEFKRELYDPNVSAATLFDKYGTHLLTSVAMGGNISMFYTLYSTKEGVTTDQYYEVSSSLKANADVAYGGFSSGVSSEISSSQAEAYQTIANKYGIRVEKKIVVSGGSGSFGIINEASLLNNYADWQNSLDAYPVVVGIKDSNSLYPIWQLIDTSVPGGAERYQELYNYFAKYGADSYNSLCETYGITAPVAPTDITSISVKSYTDYMPGEIVQIKAGDSFQITFDVIPDDANKYKKTFSSDSEYVTVDESGNVTVASDIPNQLPVTVTITAGPIEKVINMTVISTCNVIFNTVVADITVPSIIGINSASTISEPTVTREGYILDGWYRDAGYESKFNFDSDLVITNLVLYAKWIPIKPVVTFNTNGGSEVESQTLAYNGKITKPQNPTLDGYTFIGWFLDRELTEGFDFDTPIKTDTTLFAKWEIITYTVKFETNGGTPIADKFTNVERGYKITEVTTEKTDSIFKGWYLEADFFTEFTFDDRIVKDTTLYAKWEAVKPVVTFNTNGGSEVESQTVAYGSTAAKPNNPTKDGYTFVGWFADAELTEAFDFATPLTKKTTLYAKWSIITYTVKFEANGGTPIADKFTNVDRGYKIAEVIPEKTNFIFKGWYLDPDFFTEFTFDDRIVKDTTLYAKWEAVKPVVTFVTNGGSSIESQTIEYNTAVSEPSAPTLEGYRFAGWYADKELAVKFDFSTKLLTHKTLYAKWEVVTYTVTFVTNGGTEVSDKTTDIDKNMLIGEPTSIRSGYELCGWYVDEECEIPFSFDTKVTRNMTLYAAWTPINITVTFCDSDGYSTLVTAEGEEITTKSTNIEKDYKLSEIPQPYKEGYIFLGWKMGGSEIDLLTYEFSNVNASYKVVAIWIDERYAAPVTIRVDYVYEDGSIAAEQYVNSTDYYFEQTYSIDSPIIEGYAASELTVTGQVPESELVLRVVYTPAPYSLIINYVMQDGTEAPESDSIPIIYGTSYSVTIDEIEGYTADKAIITGTMDSKNVEVTVTYVPNSYTLSIVYIMSNGAPAPETATYTLVYNSVYSIETDEIKGYTADMTLISGKMPARDFEVIITYIPKEYTVTVNYAVADGSVELPATVKTYKNAESYSISVDSLLGFTPDVSVVSGTINAENISVTVTYYQNSYSVLYDANGGSGTTEATSYVYNESGNLAVSTFERSGYVFTGWNTKANGTGTAYENSELIINLTSAPNGTITLYAQWISLSFDAKTGLDVSVKGSVTLPSYVDTVTLGASFNFPVPTAQYADYYSFLGWYTADGTKLTDSNGKSVSNWGITEDTVVYAVWEQTYEDYIYIHDEDDFKNHIGNNLQKGIETDGKYMLLDDIVLKDWNEGWGYTYWAANNESTTLNGKTCFTGEFDGKDHTITYTLRIGKTDLQTWAFGLFPVTDGATIKNLNVIADLSTYDPQNRGQVHDIPNEDRAVDVLAGGLIGYAYNTTVINCSVSGRVYYNSAGGDDTCVAGMIGYAHMSTVIDCDVQSMEIYARGFYVHVAGFIACYYETTYSGLTLDPNREEEATFIHSNEDWFWEGGGTWRGNEVAKEIRIIPA